jgi:hypothetical protein
MMCEIAYEFATLFHDLVADAGAVVLKFIPGKACQAAVNCGDCAYSRHTVMAVRVR